MITHLLNQWGAYMRANHSEYLGYSKRNPIHRMMKEGVGAAQSTAPVVIETPEDVEVVEKAVEILPPRLKEALYCKYVHRLSVRRSARRMQLGKDKCSSVILAAESRVGGFIEGVKISA